MFLRAKRPQRRRASKKRMFLQAINSQKRGCLKIKSFRFENEYDYEYEIFSILSSARARNSGIWAGKRDSRRHSTTSFRANVVLAKVRSFIILPDRESA